VLHGAPSCAGAMLSCPFGPWVTVVVVAHVNVSPSSGLEMVVVPE
jgi:hypothetical protein